MAGDKLLAAHSEALEEIGRLLDENIQLRQKLKRVQKAAKEYRRHRAFEEFSVLMAERDQARLEADSFKVAWYEAWQKFENQRAANRALLGMERRRKYRAKLKAESQGAPQEAVTVQPVE